MRVASYITIKSKFSVVSFEISSDPYKIFLCVRAFPHVLLASSSLFIGKNNSNSYRTMFSKFKSREAMHQTRLLFNSVRI